MLGIKKVNFIIKEPIASKIREQLKRYHEGNFTKEELNQIKRQKEILSKYKAVWKDKDGTILYED